MPKPAWFVLEACKNPLLIFYFEEYEIHFNHKREDLYKLVLKMCRERPLC